MTSLRLCRLGILAALAFGTSVSAKVDFDPSAVDLAALIECRSDVSTYYGFAFWLNDADARALGRGGLAKVESGNTFLSQYELAQPIEVFGGYRTKTIVFASAGPLAVLEGVTPQALAEKLGVAAFISMPEKFIGDRLLSEEVKTIDGLRIRRSIKLNVTNVTSHPGKTLAGCSYRVDVE